MNSKPSDQPSEGRAHLTSGYSLGEQLRRTRTARDISLREISEQTRISMRHLEAIEADDYKHLPGGIFNRSFIKSYAKQIGFDETEALEAYVRSAHEHGVLSDEVVTTIHRPRVYTDADSSRSPIVTALLTVVILGILALGVFAGLHWYKRQNTNQTAPPTLPTAAQRNNVAPISETSFSVSAAPSSSDLNTAVPAKFTVQVKAVNKDVWIRTKFDEATATEKILKPNTGAQEFAPRHYLSLQYDKRSADALEVTVNGRPTKLPTEAAGSLAEFVIDSSINTQLQQ